MLLAADVGNTQTVLGLYQNEELEQMWRVATNKDDTSDELRIKIIALLAAAEIDTEAIHGVALASVVPNLRAAWVEAAKDLLDINAFVLCSETAGDLFITDYDNPHEIGADRVADAVAAKHLYGAPVIVVDFGTATNIEIIDSAGVFIGGIIAPGMETSASALFSHAAQLAATQLVEPPQAIGRSTEQAVQSGIILGEADKVDGLVKRIFAQIGYETPVVATGGLASTIADASSTITAVIPELTLEGLRLIYEQKFSS